MRWQPFNKKEKKRIEMSGGAAWYSGLFYCLLVQGSAVQILLSASLLVLFFVFILTCVNKKKDSSQWDGNLKN